MSSQMQKASTPQEMLLQFVLDGRVSEEVFTSTLQVCRPKLLTCLQLILDAIRPFTV